MSEQRPSDERCPLCDEATVCGHEFHARTSDYRCSCCGRTWSGCACMLNANSKRTQNTEHTDKPNQHFLRVMDTMTGDAIDYDLDRHTFVVFPAAKPDASEQLRTSEPRCVYCKAGEPRGADGWHPGRAHQCMDYVAEPLPSNQKLSERDKMWRDVSLYGSGYLRTDADGKETHIPLQDVIVKTPDVASDV